MTFEAAEAKLRARRARRKTGVLLNQAVFEAEVNELTLQDDPGAWWAIHPETGQWMCYDGTQWVNGTPPARTESRSSAGLQEWLILFLVLVVPLQMISASSEGLLAYQLLIRRHRFWSA